MEEKKKREAYRMFKAEVDNQELQKKNAIKTLARAKKKGIVN